MQEEHIPTSAGLSSFNLLDEQKLFGGLGLRAGMAMLDLGCGVGNYSVAASPHVGGQGMIHALDLWEEGVETLAVRAEIGRLANIRAGLADAGGTLPVAGESIDLCLMATVVHILVQEGMIGKTLAEVRRVLKPQGRVAVVEFLKVSGPPGPPLAWRLSPAELAQILAPAGLHCRRWLEVGPFNYLSLFSLQG